MRNAWQSSPLLNLFCRFNSSWYGVLLSIINLLWWHTAWGIIIGLTVLHYLFISIYKDGMMRALTDLANQQSATDK